MSSDPLRRLIRERRHGMMTFGLGAAFDGATRHWVTGLVYPLAALGMVWLVVFLFHAISVPVAAANKLTRKLSDAEAERAAQEQQIAELRAALEAERNKTTPLELLQGQLDRARTLVGVVSRGVPQHWEKDGEEDVLVPDDREAPARQKERVYQWFKETYALIRRPPFTRYQDDFWGDSHHRLERGHLRTVFEFECGEIGLVGLLEKRIALLKRILQEQGA